MRRSRLRPPPGPLPQTPVTDALAATKFAPPRVPPGWVARPRLDAALERGLQSPLTLIAASPGAGKTALLGSWVATRSGDGPLAWLSLESLDRDRRRFWRGVLEALARAGAPGPVASLTVHPSESVDLVVPELVNALEAVETPIVLVLDDLHEVGDGAAIADLDRLLRHPPRALRIVAATRIDPPLRLGRMRLAGDLADIRERDLAFTEPETAALLCAGGTALEPDQVRDLWQRTEGWAAGLRMAALTLRTHPDPGRFVAAFAGDDVAMADYLLAEVLAQQPPELVDFLLRTSVVSLVSGELATALTGRADADQLLARLEREHALCRGDRRRPALAPLPPAAARAAALRAALPARPARSRGCTRARPAGTPRAHAPPRRCATPPTPASGSSSPGSRASTGCRCSSAGSSGCSARCSRGSRASGRTTTRRSRWRSRSTILDAGDEPGAAALHRRAAERAGAVPAARAERFALGLAAAGLIRARMRGDLAGAERHAAPLLGAATRPATATCARSRCSTSASRGCGPAGWTRRCAISRPRATRRGPPAATGWSSSRWRASRRMRS